MEKREQLGISWNVGKQVGNYRKNKDIAQNLRTWINIFLAELHANHEQTMNSKSLSIFAFTRLEIILLGTPTPCSCYLTYLLWKNRPCY